MTIVLAVCAFAFVCIALYAITGKTRELIDEERTRTAHELARGGWITDPASPSPPIGRSLIGDDDRDALIDGVFPPTKAEGDDVP